MLVLQSMPRRDCVRGAAPQGKLRRVTTAACLAQPLLSIFCCTLSWPGPISVEQKCSNIWRILLESIQRDHMEHTVKVITAVCFVNCC